MSALWSYQRKSRGTFRARFGLVCAALLLSSLSLAAEESVIRLPEGSAFPESVAAADDGTLFVSSLTDGGVLRIKPGATEAEVWIEPGAFGTRSTFGLLVDEERQLLWVCSNDASMMGVAGPSNVKGSFVKGFDLATGKGAVSVELPSQPAICNDMVIGRDKSLYVSNTAQPQILRLPDGASAFEIWVEDDRLQGGLDGLAFGSDGRLYVNTFMEGKLFAIAAEGGQPGEISQIKLPRPLMFPDALKADGAGFLMVEGGGPLSRVTIDEGQAILKPIANFSGPSGLVRVGNSIWVSEGQIVSLMDPSRQASLPTGFDLKSVEMSGN